MLRKSLDKPTVNDNQLSVLLNANLDDSQNFFKEFEPKLEKHNILPSNPKTFSNRKRNRSNLVMAPELQTCDHNFSSIGNGLLKTTQDSRNGNSRLSQLSKTNPTGFDNKRAGSCIQPTNVDLFPRTIQNVSANTQFFKGHNYQLKAIPNVKIIDPNQIQKADKVLKLKKDQI